MKRNIRLIFFMIVLCLTMSGCNEQKEYNKKYVNNGNENYQSEEFDEEKIKEPVVDWWKLYKNINKQNCVTLQVSNPNKFPIQFSYDLVYYKNNEVVKSETRWAMTGMDSLKKGIIYGDIDIPSSLDVDNIKLENIEVTKFEWKVLNGTFTKSLIDNNSQYFDVKFPEKPRHTEIWVALYNDTNKNKKVEKEEFVQMGLLAPFVGIYETEGQIKIAMPDNELMYTDYEIYSFDFINE